MLGRSRSWRHGGIPPWLGVVAAGDAPGKLPADGRSLSRTRGPEAILVGGVPVLLYAGAASGRPLAS